MSLSITAAVERWPVAGQFIIARGAKTYVDVLVVAVSDGTYVGMGEGTAIYYQDESAESRRKASLTIWFDLIQTPREPHYKRYCRRVLRVMHWTALYGMLRQRLRVFPCGNLSVWL